MGGGLPCDEHHEVVEHRHSDDREPAVVFVCGWIHDPDLFPENTNLLLGGLKQDVIPSLVVVICVPFKIVPVIFKCTHQTTCRWRFWLQKQQEKGLNSHWDP